MALLNRQQSPKNTMESSKNALCSTEWGGAAYDRGNRTIDHIFGISQVTNSMARGGALSFYHFIQADHRALYIDFDARRLLVDHKKMTIHQDTDPSYPQIQRN